MYFTSWCNFWVIDNASHLCPICKGMCFPHVYPCITFLPSPFPGARSPRHQLGENTQAFRSQKREDTSLITVHVSQEDRMLNSAAWFWRIAALVSSVGQYSRLMISAGLELAVYTSHRSRGRSWQHSHSDLILS